jgi:hypothetical protein
MVPIADRFLRLGILLHLEIEMVPPVPGVSVMRPKKAKQGECQHDTGERYVPLSI